MTGKTFRTRFAPSPTGPPHLGMIHTALFAYIAARKRSGELILRVDDTDRERSGIRWENEIIEALRYLGISWSEGPDVGGPYAPYRQSERTGIYEDAIEKLKADGYLYPCFCTEADLNIQRAASRAAGRPYVYDRRCRNLQGEEIERRLGKEALEHLHCHFTKIEYTEKGEKRHHTMDETEFGPDFRLLAKAIAEYDLKPVIISESPVLDVDAVKMRDILMNELKAKRAV